MGNLALVNVEHDVLRQGLVSALGTRIPALLVGQPEDLVHEVVQHHRLANGTGDSAQLPVGFYEFDEVARRGRDGLQTFLDIHFLLLWRQVGVLRQRIAQRGDGRDSVHNLMGEDSYQLRPRFLLVTLTLTFENPA